MAEGTSGKIKDIGFTFFRVKEVMEDLKRKRDVIEAKGDHNPTEQTKGVRRKLTKRDAEIGCDFFKERRKREV